MYANSARFKELSGTFDYRTLPSATLLGVGGISPLLTTRQPWRMAGAGELDKIDPVILYVKELGYGGNLPTVREPSPSFLPVTRLLQTTK